MPQSERDELLRKLAKGLKNIETAVSKRACS